MTATIVSDAGAASVSSPFGPLAGFRPLVRKDATEWLRGRRAWVILFVTTAFMALSAANAWIVSQIAASLPPGSVNGGRVLSLVPMDNLLAAVSSQIFVLATIFVAGSLMARERESGTLAWVASKPVTRTSIWLSKWSATTAMLAVFGGLVPLAVTVALVIVLYGALPVGLVIGLALGVVATVAFFTALALAAGTVLPGQAPTIAAVLGIFALLPIVAGLVPFPIGPYLPTAILAWPAMALTGASVSLATPVAWFVATGGLTALAIRRMGRLEL